MKKIVALILMLSLLLTGTAFAGTAVTMFGPHTTVDLSVFESAGYSCYYNEMEFNAELTAPVKITIEGQYDTYTIQPDLKILWNGENSICLPRLIFTRDGMKTYFDDRMENVLIKVGENRYRVSFDSVSRSSSSKNSTATDSSVAPFGPIGAVAVEEMGNSPLTVKVKMGSYADVLTLSAADMQVIADFYALCEQAGVFEQASFRSYVDNFGIITLFNEAPAEEPAAEEPAAEEPAEEEPAAGEPAPAPDYSE